MDRRLWLLRIIIEVNQWDGSSGEVTDLRLLHSHDYDDACNRIRASVIHTKGIKQEDILSVVIENLTI